MRKLTRLKRIIWTGVALALLLGTGYAYLTRPSALRAKLVALFQQFDLRIVRIGGISFSPWSGLQVRDMQVAAAEGSPLASQTRVQNPPPLLRVPRARVSVNPWALLVGRFQPREVELDAPAIAVIWPEPDRSASREPRGAYHIAGPGDVPPGLPRLKINNADIEVLVTENGRLRLVRRWVVDGSGAQAKGDGSQPRAYVLRFDQVAGPVSSKHRPGSPLAEVRWQAGQLTAKLGWVDLELVHSLLPATWTELTRPLQLSGQARARQLVLDRDGLAAMEVSFDDLQFWVPVEDDRDGAPDIHFARVTDAAGTFAYAAARPADPGAPLPRRGELHLEVSGRLNGAPAEFALALFDTSYAAQSGADGSGQAETPGLGGLKPGKYEMSLRVEGLALPTAAEHPQFVSSQRLPGALRSAFRKYNAEGRVNLRLNIRGEVGPEGKTTTQYRGELEAVGAACCYVGFPYVIDDVHGLVRFSNDGVRLEGLHGRHGSGRIRLDGKLTDTTSETGFELSFRGHNIATDDDLYRALPPEYRRLWERAAPVALCDVHTTLRREHGSLETGTRDTRVRVDARLLSGSLRLLDGGQLENIDGLVRIAGDTVELNDLHGYLDGAPLRLSGTLTLPADDASPPYDLHVEVADAPLQRASEVRDGEGRPIGEIRFEGIGDIWGQVSSGDHAMKHYAVHVTDGVLTGFAASAPWTQTNGWITLRGDEQRILSLKALREDGRLTVSGSLPTHMGLDTPIALDLHAADADLDRLLRQLMPGRWSNIREALGLAGRGKLAARFYPRVGEGTGSRQAADIELEAERMQPTPFSLQLSDIAARLTLRADGFDVHEATARYGADGRLAVSGHGGWSETSAWSDAKVEAWGLELTPELVEAMPESLASLLRRLAPRGRMWLTLDQVQMTGSKQHAWDVVGRLRLQDGELDIGLPLTEFDGVLDGSCHVDPDGQVELEAEFAIDRGRLASRPIERWDGRLTRRRGSSRLRLEDVHGRLCDGEIVGSVLIDPDTSTYELAFTLQDVSLDQLLPRDQEEPGRPRRGRLDGRIFVRGDTKDPTQRIGGGDLRIRGASLLSSPVTASVVETSRRQKRSISDEVDRAELRFVWEGQELKFTKVDIHSRDLRLIGVGRWNMRSDEISMTLLGATPEDAPRLFVLTDLLESAGQELLQYQIEGTAAHPRVTLEPLHNLTDPLRKLLRGEGR